MSEAIEKFAFEGSQVRVVMQNNEPWFVAKDVCNILGTRTDTVKGIVGEKRVRSINPNQIGVDNRGGRDMLIVNESGVYRLAMRSDKPSAEKFQDWVTDEVLPTIRKTGSYIARKPVACQHAITCAPTSFAESLRMMADEMEAHELTMGVLKETTLQRDDALETVKEQKKQIDWIDSQRIDMADSVARFSPIGEQPEDSIPVRGIFRRKTKKADGEFDKPQNSHYSSMIRRAISRLVMYDYELEEFRTVMKADEIKGTKHTKDECVLLELYNDGRIQIATTLMGE